MILSALYALAISPVTLVSFSTANVTRSSVLETVTEYLFCKGKTRSRACLAIRSEEDEVSGDGES